MTFIYDGQKYTVSVDLATLYNKDYFIKLPEGTYLCPAWKECPLEMLYVEEIGGEELNSRDLVALANTSK